MNRKVTGCELGSNNLWINRGPGTSQEETWLEMVTAAAQLKAAHVVHGDDIEPLSAGLSKRSDYPARQRLFILCAKTLSHGWSGTEHRTATAAIR